tara:strand:+ start:268 stop:453 length:186 start_codon:yes stop_codon:yes gene_type:complete
MLKFLGTFLILAGLMAIAGSAGDCDGDCMEYANSLEQMMIICLVGFSMMATGGYILYKENV